jgi:hypothetical protein
MKAGAAAWSERPSAAAGMKAGAAAWSERPSAAAGMKAGAAYSDVHSRDQTPCDELFRADIPNGRVVVIYDFAH